MLFQRGGASLPLGWIIPYLRGSRHVPSVHCSRIVFSMTIDPAFRRSHLSEHCGFRERSNQRKAHFASLTKAVSASRLSHFSIPSMPTAGANPRLISLRELMGPVCLFFAPVVKHSKNRARSRGFRSHETDSAPCVTHSKRCCWQNSRRVTWLFGPTRRALFRMPLRCRRFYETVSGWSGVSSLIRPR